MKERGMIFNAEMVRAILDGRKTQTRRIVKSDCMDIGEKDDGTLWPWREHDNGGDYWYPCPFGAVGDRIWVRETFATLEPGSYEPVKPQHGYCQDLRYAATDRLAKSGSDIRGYKWIPSLHMPRWASRITLEITGVRVERIASISTESARAEGYPAERAADGGVIDPWLWFRDLWDGIYPEQSFKVNPWVWVIEFKRIEGGA
ncbi:hypothetical protein HLI26_07415 [Salmonella enterica subsp. enterica]|uniref:hypothetical protein n=1 Tax=Salmonella enterica TaxID=28901 RepID=UPI002150D354|nr:hypothetical protein [Salmonella enterica]MCR6026809.1 hypothetical protein [Salmonella enterica subsp. enterica]